MELAPRQLGLRRSALLAIACTLVVAACGTSSTDATQGTLERVLSSGTVRVGTITGNPPFESVDENGNLVGYDIDIINLFAEKTGVKIEWVMTDVAGRVTVVQSAKADMSIGSFTRNLERMKVIGFSDPYVQETTVLMAAANRPDLNTLNDFNKSGIKVAIQQGSLEGPLVEQAAPLADLLELTGVSDGIQAVINGKADGVAVANTQVGTFLAEYPEQLKVVSGDLAAPNDDCIGLPQGDFVWWEYVNQFVREINNDGTNYELYQKWFGPGSSPGPFAEPPIGS